MITLPDTLQSAVVRHGLTVEFKPEMPSGSTVKVRVLDRSGHVVARSSHLTIDEDTGSIISFIEGCLRRYNRGPT